jgi:hypothetical protein
MKYIIKEGQLQDLIFKQIESYFDKNDINVTQYIDEDNIAHDAYAYHYGEYTDDLTLFRYYGNDYFTEPNFETPFIQLEYKYRDSLNNLFGDLWKNPFKVWFEKNFKKPVLYVK